VAQDGTLQRFAADFEQHCSDSVPALIGAIRYNTAVGEVLPFGGAFPRYQLSLATPTGGRVSAVGIACGGASTQCILTLPAAAPVTLTARADAGYTFMGWTEDCSGGATTTLHLNGVKRCAALFEPRQPAPVRTLLRWSSQPEVYVGQGRSETLSPGNSRWTASGYENGGGVQFRVQTVGPRNYVDLRLTLTAPSGEILEVGRRYANARQYSEPGVAGIGLTGHGSACGGGEFTVLEAAFGPQNAVLGFSATFVLNCGIPGGPPVTGAVQYNSGLALTTLSVDPGVLRFAALHNGAAVTTQPSSQTVRVTVGSPDVGWTAVASQPWIELSPSSGTGTSVMSVGVNVLGEHPGMGSTTGNILVRLNDGTSTSRTINLSLTLYFNGTTTPPVGLVDTPLQHITGVTGAIPMTGWALDDLELESVTICRAPAGGEAPGPNANCGGAAEVFVGNGVFIEGARPDVLAAYPNHPRADRAGWGFMLLTNMLPDGGNGTFVFSVYARDREGYSTLLGTRTMTCDNAHATAPFGTIDTPGQGATISGSSYINFGWALTPNPKSIPTDGSTLMVYVDGLPIGRPTYNNYRADIATLFPGLANSNGAVGYRFIDTSTLLNGLHTISWSVTDSLGVTSGLGSRYFRAANGVGASTAASGFSRTTTVDMLPLDESPIVGRRGWSADAPWMQYTIGRSGRAIVRGEEIDRFELALGEWPGDAYAGYVRAGNQLLPLPVGSHLNSETGAFTWSPGVGFVGTYDLVFVRSANGEAVARREVRFILAPKGSGHVGAQVVIDTPREQQDVAQPFTLAGWAADRDAASGNGITALHVWAYPLGGGAPVFLGTAARGGTRPDVAAVLGEQFRDAGWGLTVQGLGPGAYDLAVFAWSNVSGGFVPAQVVRVTVR
jgi:hypothetical protein